MPERWNALPFSVPQRTCLSDFPLPSTPSLVHWAEEIVSYCVSTEGAL